MDIFDLPLQLSYYQKYHRNPTNVLIHLYCIPLILSTAMVMAGYYPLLQQTAMALYSGYYLILHLPAGIVSTGYLYITYITSNYLYATYATRDVIVYSLAVHIVCWILQIIGHKKFEHNSPAVLDNPIQPLVLAPYFVVFELFWMMGLFKNVYSTNFDVRGKNIIIAGASQGLGKELSNQLNRKGANLILLARSKDKLDDIVSNHELSTDQFSLAHQVDLTNANEVEAFKDWLLAKDIIPDTVICCVGSAMPKFFTDLSIKEIDQGININYKSCIYLLHYLLPVMKTTKTKGRHVVILSSSVAFYSFAGYAQYAPLKAALKSLGDSLRQELKPFGIKVSTVFPGNFESEGYIEENLTKPKVTAEIEGSSKPISVEECSNIIIESLQRGTTYIHTDWTGWLLNSFSLGFNPRSHWTLIPLQIVLALVGSLIARLVDLYHERLVQNAIS